MFDVDESAVYMLTQHLYSCEAAENLGGNERKLLKFNFSAGGKIRTIQNMFRHVIKVCEKCKNTKIMLQNVSHPWSALLSSQF